MSEGNGGGRSGSMGGIIMLAGIVLVAGLVFGYIVNYLAKDRENKIVEQLSRQQSIESEKWRASREKQDSEMAARMDKISAQVTELSKSKGLSGTLRDNAWALLVAGVAIYVGMKAYPMVKNMDYRATPVAARPKSTLVVKKKNNNKKNISTVASKRKSAASPGNAELDKLIAEINSLDAGNPDRLGIAQQILQRVGVK